jgi:hypothetical protein
MKKYDISCPMCCGTFHETTEHYTNKTMANGSMLTALQHIRDAGWSTFPEYDSTDAADLVCPSCGAQYCDSMGKLIRMQENGEVEKTFLAVDLGDLMDKLMAEYEVDLPSGQKEEPIKKKPGRPKVNK